MKWICASLLVLSSSIAQANSSQSIYVTINRPFVKLKDLFPISGLKSNDVIGPAPAPGEQYEVGSAQLAKIAKKYDVSFQPYMQAGITISRIGVAIPKNVIKAAVAHVLETSDIISHPKIIFRSYLPPMVPPGAKPTNFISHMAYDSSTNLFRAILLTSAPEMKTKTTVIEGFAQKTFKIIVASHTLQPGDLLNSSNITLRRVPENHLSGTQSNMSKIIGLQVKSLISRNSPILRSNLNFPKVILKGNLITLIVKTVGLEVAARGIALTSGRIGGTINVLNPSSHESVQAVVTGYGVARVDPENSSFRAIPQRINYSSYYSAK